MTGKFFFPAFGLAVFGAICMLPCIIGHSESPKTAEKKFQSLCPDRLNYDLPDEVRETSGLCWFRNLLWTINDSGNDPIIYSIRPSTGEIAKSIRLLNARNIDWEDITIDKKWMYIGDFGNNDGSRKNLCIYRISLDSINENSVQLMDAERIDYNYEDQLDFRSVPYGTEWDAEAFVVWSDSIYIFTKDWKNEGTTIYVLSNMPVKQVALRKSSIKLNGVLTGASFDFSKENLAFCGYDKFQPFIAICKAKATLNQEVKNLIEYRCDSLYGVQVEGITFDPVGNLFISSEASVIPQSLFYFDKEDLKSKY
jgi:hypothetical protein